MELKIYSPSDEGFVQSIEWNYDEIKNEVADKMKHYASLVYSEEQIKEAKADRAKLNKFVQALDSKRKEIKKQCLAPYEAFEKQIFDVIGLVNEPIMLIDSQVREYQDKLKAEKLEAIKAYWLEILQADKVPEAITFNQIFNEKWLNATVSMKAIQAEIDAKIEQIDKDLATLAKMPEFSFEAIEVYKDKLDINIALSEGQRLVEIQKRKAEAEAQKAATVEQPKPEAVQEQPTSAEIERRWIGFQAYLSTEEASALGAFLKSRNIQYKAI